MEITPVPATLSLPLPIYTTVKLGDARDKKGEAFSVLAGLDEHLVAQLKGYSLNESDEDIQKNTSDRKRFGEGSYEEWYSKSRTPFALVHKKTGTLAALAWFGPKPLGRKSLKHLSEEELQKEYEQKETEWHTIVYRSYTPYRGTGLMKSFVSFVMDAYQRVYPGSKLWAGIHAENPASVGFAESLGFKVLEEVSHRAERHLVMVKE